MNNYISEIIGICQLPLEEISKTLKIIQIGSKSVCVSNYIKILGYSDDLVDLKGHDEILHIDGKELKIKMLNKNEIVIAGKISSLRLEAYGRN